jgi:hypothetical protein
MTGGDVAITREWIIAEIARLADESGTAPGQKAFERQTGIHQWDWRGRFWTKWSDALADAGFEPLEWNRRADDQAVIESLARQVRQLGHFPTRAELMMRRRENPDVPSEATLRRRGNRAQLIRLTIEFCDGEPEDWSDVLSILRPLAGDESVEPHRTEHPSSEPIAGYVYLIKSDKFYKIGFSTDVQRRMLQLNTGMPRAGELMHTISTDDPAGIEQYWHSRFADKRVRSDAEWFDLTADDIRAFKRRKFQ